MKVIVIGAVLLLAACQDVPDLDGDWVLTHLKGETVPDDVQITLSVADGGVTGRAACNGYMGSLVRDGAKVSFGPLASTKMACPPPLMEWERRFLAAMQEVSLAEGAAASLSLSDDAGDTVLVFRSSTVR